MATTTKPKEHHLTEAILARIVRAVEDMDYGTVQITIHNSRVVQIDKVERIRILREDFLEIGQDI